MKFATILLLTTTACGGDAFFSFPPDSGDANSEASDAAGDAATAGDAAMAVDSNADAPDTGCPISTGQSACTSVLAAYCTRFVQCGWTSLGDEPSCEAYFQQQTTYYKCSSVKYAKNVCTSATAACTADLSTVSCSYLYNTMNMTISPPGLVVNSCTTFFNQF